MAGGTQIFNATATNWTSVEWSIADPNGNYFCNATRYGYRSGDNFYITNIPVALNNYRIYAAFSNANGTSYTNAAIIKVEQPSKTYPIQVVSRTGGWVNVASQANAGDTVNFEIYPNSEYEIVSVRINDVGYSIGTRSFVMPSSMAIIDVEYRQSYTPTPIPVTTRTIYLTEFGEGGYVSNIPFSAEPGETVYFTLELTNSQAMESVDITCCNSASKVSFTSSGMIYSFVMPNDDVNVSVGWSIPA